MEQGRVHGGAAMDSEVGDSSQELGPGAQVPRGRSGDRIPAGETRGPARGRGRCRAESPLAVLPFGGGGHLGHLGAGSDFLAMGMGPPPGAFLCLPFPRLPPDKHLNSEFLGKELGQEEEEEGHGAHVLATVTYSLA